MPQPYVRSTPLLTAYLSTNPRGCVGISTFFRQSRKKSSDWIHRLGNIAEELLENGDAWWFAWALACGNSEIYPVLRRRSEQF